MRLKRLHVGIRNVSDVMIDFADAAKALERGEEVRCRKGLYFTDLKAFRRAFTDRRLAILRAIRTTRPDSVYELAKSLGRDVKNVAADLAILEELGLVELRKTNQSRGQVRPMVSYDAITLDIAVGA